MQPSIDRPLTVPEDTGLFVHYSTLNAYGIRFHNLYEEEEPDNWLINEIRAGRYTLYKIPNTNIFQAIKRTSNRSEREIIELILSPEIDRPLVEGQLTIDEGEWTVDEYPGFAEMIRYDPLPTPRLAMGAPHHQDGGGVPLPTPQLAPMPQIPALLAPPASHAPMNSLLLAALLLDTPVQHRGWYDLGDTETQPITAPIPWQPAPFLLPYNCAQYNRPTVDSPKKRIADILIADAVSKGEQCCISMNPLTPDTASCVAPCYHIFETEAIKTWLATKHTCPTCREPCVM